MARAAWTQSITRGRWLTIKVAVALGSLVVLAIPLGVTVTWFLRVSEWTPRISTDGFTYGGWMPLAVGVFAFAMATITKGDKTVGQPSDPAPAIAWVLFNGYVPVDYDNTLPTSGQATSWMYEVNRCPANFAFPTRYATCLKKLGLHNVELYVADNQYWELQLREGGLYLASAALLLGANFLLVRRARA
ncbi:MAG: hypothetical protein KGJ92_09075 [Actinomycetales bacterium]|nr:hypothetical protein [Actinomycetales bacterium]